MPINQNRYVEITSGVGAGQVIPERELIARLFTTNPLVPTKSYLEFESADEVGDYFGTASEEYKRAVFYFGWISKNITSPQKISYARWVDTAVGSRIFGAPGVYSLLTFTPITTGDFTLTMAGYTGHVTGIDLSAAGSLAAVATAVQTAIRAVVAGGAGWTGAVVAFDATRGCFNLTSGTTGNDVISIAAGSITDLAGPLGWLSPNTILSNGSTIQSITDVLAASAEQSNNFGSFLFIPTLTQDQVVEAAQWNDLQNVFYQYCVRVSSSNAAALSAALEDLSGTDLTLAPLSAEYPEMAPMMILAATDYTKRNSVQNYMFQQFDLTPSVTTDADANTYDNLRVNYYGQTQSAGQLLEFYQRGVMTGGANDPVDQNVYANEQWLKDSAGAALLTLLMALAKVSANAQGRSQIMATLQSVIDQALFNGTISVGKPLTNTQKLYITNATGDDKAWYQVQNIGYWVDVVLAPYTGPGGITQWKAIYTLIYSKDDVIRKVEGTHILI